MRPNRLLIGGNTIAKINIPYLKKINRSQFQSGALCNLISHPAWNVYFQKNRIGKKRSKNRVLRTLDYRLKKCVRSYHPKDTFEHYCVARNIVSEYMHIRTMSQSDELTGIILPNKLRFPVRFELNPSTALVHYHRVDVADFCNFINDATKGAKNVFALHSHKWHSGYIDEKECMRLEHFLGALSCSTVRLSGNYIGRCVSAARYSLHNNTSLAVEVQRNACYLSENDMPKYTQINQEIVTNNTQQFLALKQTLASTQFETFNTIEHYAEMLKPFSEINAIIQHFQSHLI